MKGLLIRLYRSDRGQDLIEYALLTAGIGFAGLSAWPAIVDALGIAYGQLDQQTQDLWAPCNPGETHPCP